MALVFLRSENCDRKCQVGAITESQVCYFRSYVEYIAGSTRALLTSELLLVLYFHINTCLCLRLFNCGLYSYNSAIARTLRLPYCTMLCFTCLSFNAFRGPLLLSPRSYMRAQTCRKEACTQLSVQHHCQMNLKSLRRKFLWS